MSNLDWSDWRAPYFRRQPRRLPVGYRSHEREAWDAEIATREEHWQAELRTHAAEQQQQRINEAAAQLRRLVERFGSEAVVTIRRRIDPSFVLPADLRGIAASYQED